MIPTTQQYTQEQTLQDIILLRHSAIYSQSQRWLALKLLKCKIAFSKCLDSRCWTSLDWT